MYMYIYIYVYVHVYIYYVSSTCPSNLDFGCVEARIAFISQYNPNIPIMYTDIPFSVDISGK